MFYCIAGNVRVEGLIDYDVIASGLGQNVLAFLWESRFVFAIVDGVKIHSKRINEIKRKSPGLNRSLNIYLMKSRLLLT